MALEMVRLQIIGLKSQLEEAIRVLHSLECVQIEDLVQGGDISARPLRLSAATQREHEEVAYLLAKVEGLAAAVASSRRQKETGREAHKPELAATPPADSFERDCVPEARAGVDELGPIVQELIGRREAVEAEQTLLPRYIATLQKLLPMVPPAAREPSNITVGAMVSRTHVAVLDTLGEQVVDLTGGRAQLVAENIDATTRAMLLVFPRDYAEEVEALLTREDVTRLRLPDTFANQSPDVALEGMQQRLRVIPEEMKEIDGRLAALREEWGGRLSLWRACLRERTVEFAVLSRLGETDQTFVLEGWTPKRDLPRVREALRARLGDSLLIETPPLTHADRKRVPVAMDNPRLSKPFESLVKLLSLPSYEGIDPTVLMSFFLPIFFGMILGDIGYAALLLLACLYLLRRLRKPGTMRDIVKVLTMGSIWGIVFGVLYGEVFGTLGPRLGLHPLWIDRTSPTQVAGLLYFSVAVGAVHITLGLVLGVWEAVRERSRNLLLERGGMLVGLIGLFLLVAVVVKWLPHGFMTPAVAAVIVGIALLGASLGWLGLLMGPIEFVGLIGNVLSYLRIAAIGLASVYLARVANDMAGSLGNVLVGIVVALLIHALNLVLGAFSPTIHSLRLHYVEFFRKFYEGGGRPFEPLRRDAWIQPD